MAKIAADVLARGEGWRVTEVVCSAGPEDRPYEEQHELVSVSVVAAGTFQYRSHAGRDLMSPGSLLLGTPGRSFECGHEHGRGDRCIAFHYAPAYFESIVSSAPRFRAQRLPPLRATAPLVARALSRSCWEELAIELAARAASLANDVDIDSFDPPPSAVARVTEAVRSMEAATLPLRDLAANARLSPYHFLRTFTRIAGVTPHQFALRARLRAAAVRLAESDARIIDVALDSGFGDLSNFNRAFRGEFGTSPSHYRSTSRAKSVDIQRNSLGKSEALASMSDPPRFDERGPRFDERAPSLQ